MRKQPFITGLMYHIYNRGVDKRDIFANKQDVARFVSSIKVFNTKKPTGNLRDNLYKREDKENPLVSIICYCLNPNHFHFVLKQERDGGISEFMKRLSGGYTNYFNKIQKRSGSLLQGSFKSCLISTDQYFLKIFPYVNVNYLVHDIPKEKMNLVKSSNEEYENNKFNLVSKKEAGDLLEFYGGLEEFKKECKIVVDLTREERGKKTIFLE